MCVSLFKDADKFKEEFERCQQNVRDKMDSVTAHLEKLTVQEDEVCIALLTYQPFITCVPPSSPPQAKGEEVGQSEGQSDGERRHEDGASGEGNSEPADSEAEKSQDKASSDTASAADPE